MSTPATLLIVDAANVVGSVPDGWWRDRARATTRLRDALAATAGAVEVVLIVEGAARGVTGVPGVRVVVAPGSGDAAVVEVVRAEGSGRDCVVATADRELIAQVTALGARVIGPRTVRSGWAAPEQAGQADQIGAPAPGTGKEPE